MALSIMMWDLPSEERIENYNQQARTVWIPSLLKQPGVKEFRAYRNPYHTAPQIMIHIEWDSLASWLKYVESEDYAAIVSGLRAAGCTEIEAEIWGASPVVPEPLRPPSG